jgi:hypothetical protein
MTETQERLRENSGWNQLESKVIGLANIVVSRALTAVEADEAEKAAEWINLLHGTVSAVQRMNDEATSPFARVLSLTVPDADAEDDDE